MGHRKGIIAIMGSGETTDSMIRVHRHLLDSLSLPVKAVFIDTPAGFQMNADDLFEKAKEYFARRLNQPLDPVSFKSAKDLTPSEAERAFQTLRQADYIFVGPGSPTYALKNWIHTPIPRIIADRVLKGACFVAASAAALTLGRFTLPVYEIYKVGEEPRWVSGLDLMGGFSLPLVVIPHWNNAEGGTHDTRFCYMGERRLNLLEGMLPPSIPILGIDEHTACILDLETREISVKGIGEVTLRYRGDQRIFRSGQTLPWSALAGFDGPPIPEENPPSSHTHAPSPAEFFQVRVDSLEGSFQNLLHSRRGGELADVLVALDKWIWKHCGKFEDEELISQAREAFRGMIVRLGLQIEEGPQEAPSILPPLLEAILETREKLRSAKQWALADAVRNRLLRIGIVIEDTPEGPRWRETTERIR